MRWKFQRDEAAARKDEAAARANAEAARAFERRVSDARERAKISAEAALRAKSAPVMRAYQEQATKAVLGEFSAGRPATLLVMPTGTGKTVVFSEVARRLGAPTLVVAHRRELIEQATASLYRAGVVDYDVRSVQSTNPMWLRSNDLSRYGLVVIDEAHHATAASYRAIVEHTSHAKILGVTATPDRHDEAALSSVFGTCAFRYTLTEAIKDRALVPVLAKRVVVDGIDLSRVGLLAKDLRQDQLAEVMEKAEVVQGVTAPLLDLLGDRRGILFAAGVEHARALAESLNMASPGIARAVDGTASPDERRAAREDFAAGRFRILVNCQIYTEGFDDPGVSLIAVARPTRSRPLYTQMVGRGMRLHPGKENMLIVDYVGATKRHDLAGPVDVFAEKAVTGPRREAMDKRMEGDAVSADEFVTLGEVAALEAKVEYRAVEQEVSFTTRNMERWPAKKPDPPPSYNVMTAHRKRVTKMDRPSVKEVQEATKRIKAGLDASLALHPVSVQAVERLIGRVVQWKHWADGPHPSRLTGCVLAYHGDWLRVQLMSSEVMMVRTSDAVLDYGLVPVDEFIGRAPKRSTKQAAVKPEHLRIVAFDET